MANQADGADAADVRWADHGPELPSGQRVSVRALRAGDSPRLAGENLEHARMLAESGATLPPILVHPATMQVIDGMHRLRAAELRGDQTIEVEFFDGPDEEAFIAGVRANIAHGLPLTLADREAAAARILTSRPQASDRSIARITGLAAATVRDIRCRAVPGAAGTGQSRVGRDGRIRPLNSADARRLASDALSERPQASLREIADLAGLSPSTVRDVRERIRRGEDPVPPGQVATRRHDNAGPEDRRARPAGRADSAGRAEPDGTGPVRAVPGEHALNGRYVGSNRQRLLSNLSRDPSLRFTDSGRQLLRTLFARTAGPPEPDLLRSLPPHCLYTVAAIARACAQEWQDLADALEHRFDSGGSGIGSAVGQ
ncbi:MAG TPA: ParB N-terminal domain-containing protein [Rugosimonospora sp.]|nr:ParB N-terminal domain-containing protein [Rugosimonospora sp.]